MIEQALDAGYRLRQEEYHYGEIPFAHFVASHFNTKRDPKSPPIKPQYFYRNDGDDKDRIPAIALDCFASLLKEGLIPQWALVMMPEYALTHQISYPPRLPRAYISQGLIVLAPRIRGDWLEGELALSWNCEQFEELKNPHDPGFNLTVELTRELVDCVTLEPQIHVSG